MICKVRATKIKGDVRGNFLIQRVEGACELLPGVVVEAGMVVPFKRLLDRNMDMQGMERYGSCAGILVYLGIKFITNIVGRRALPILYFSMFCIAMSGGQSVSTEDCNWSKYSSL